MAKYNAADSAEELAQAVVKLAEGEQKPLSFAYDTETKLTDKIKLLNRDKGLAFCLIEHDLDYVARLCEHVLVMVQGRLLTEGTVAEVRRDERVIEAYFGGGKYEGAA